MKLSILTEEDKDIIFRNARTFSNWQNKEIEDDKLKALYDLMKYGATAANSCPLRITFVKGEEAKNRLKPLLMEANVEKTMSAPVTAILAYDEEFYNHLPRLYPQVDAKSWYSGNKEYAEHTALVSSTLQIGYFMIAARALGLDCGPMAGFDAGAVDKEFFKDKNYKSVLLCNIGYGDRDSLHPRNPRFDFEEVCEII